MFKNKIKNILFKTGKFKGLYLHIFKPSSDEYAEYYKIHGGLYSMGNNCRFNRGVNITDPAYVSVGNNVTLSRCDLIGHDGVIAMLNIAYNKNLDSVGKIQIGNNVFVGHGAIILPGVTIGDNVVIGAGSLVTKDVPSYSIYAGVPAKKIGNTNDLVEKLIYKTETLPWKYLLDQRTKDNFHEIEPELVKERVKYFYK